MTQFSKTNQPDHDRVEAGKVSGKVRLLSSALELALKRESLDDKQEKRTEAQKIANAMVRKAGEGDVQAFNAVADRTEGKAAQALTLMGDEDNPVVTKVIREIIG